VLPNHSEIPKNNSQQNVNQDINQAFDDNKVEDKTDKKIEKLAAIVKTDSEKKTDNVNANKISSLNSNNKIPIPKSGISESYEKLETQTFQNKVIGLLSKIVENTSKLSTGDAAKITNIPSENKPKEKGFFDTALDIGREFIGNRVKKVKQKVLRSVTPRSIQDRIARSNLASADRMRDHLGISRPDAHTPDIETPQRRPGLIRRLFSRTPQVDNAPIDRNNPDHTDHNRIDRNNPDHTDHNRIDRNNPAHPDHPNHPNNRRPSPANSERRPSLARRGLNATGRGIKVVGKGAAGLAIGAISMLAPNLLPEPLMDTIDQVSNAADTVGNVADLARSARGAGAVSEVAGTAARGGGLLSKGASFLGKAALPAAALYALYKGGMASMDDESIQKATGKKDVSVTDRISAGAGGALGSVLGVGDSLLSMVGINTNMEESVKQGTTSGLSKAADWSKEKLTNGMEAIGNFFTGDPAANITKPIKLDDKRQAIKEPEDKGFFGKMMDWGSNKIAEISKDPISAIASASPIGMVAKLIPDNVKNMGSNLITKGLDAGKNLLSNTSTSGVLSTIASASPIGMLANLFASKSQSNEEPAINQIPLPELTPQQQVNAMIDKDFSKSKQLAQNLSNISTNFSSETATSIQTPATLTPIPSKLIPELSTTVAVPNKNNQTAPNVSSEPPLVPYPIPNNSIQWGDKNIYPLTKDYSSGKNSNWVPSIVPTRVDINGQSNNFATPVIPPTGNVTYGQSVDPNKLSSVQQNIISKSQVALHKEVAENTQHKGNSVIPVIVQAPAPNVTVNSPPQAVPIQRPFIDPSSIAETISGNKFANAG